MIDLERYPIHALGSLEARAVVAEQRRSLEEHGVAILPGFVRPEILERLAAELVRSLPKAYLEDVWGTPYLGLPEQSFPEGHPRRTSVHSLTWVIAYDLVEPESPLRALYHSDDLLEFLAEILDRRPLYRMADPLGALNMTVMDEGHEQCWHYDNAEFVVSLAIQSSRGGGEFECASMIRSESDENYDDVARVLAGQAPERLEIHPMTPGTLMVFRGRHSLHRVTPVAGPVPRYVALLAYDTKPDTNSSDLFKLVRYGRSQPLAAGG